MFKFITVGVPAVLLAGIGLAASYQQPAVPTTAPVVGQNGGPVWHDSQDIGNGVELETVVKFCPNVTDPSTGATVRPLSIHMNLLYGVGLMTQLDYVKLHAIGDTTALQFTFEGIDRNIVVEQRPPFGPLNYVVTVSPKSGFTWGSIAGAIDLDIIATEQ